MSLLGRARICFVGNLCRFFIMGRVLMLDDLRRGERTSVPPRAHTGTDVQSLHDCTVPTSPTLRQAGSPSARGPQYVPTCVYKMNI